MSTLGLLGLGGNKIEDAQLMIRLAEERERDLKLRREQDKRKSTFNPDLPSDTVVLLKAYVDMSTKEMSCTLAKLTMASFVASHDSLVTKEVTSRKCLKLPVVYSTASRICLLLGLTEGAVNSWDEEILRSSIETCQEPGTVLDLIWHNPELTQEVDEMLVRENKRINLPDLPERIRRALTWTLTNQ